MQRQVRTCSIAACMPQVYFVEQALTGNACSANSGGMQTHNDAELGHDQCSQHDAKHIQHKEAGKLTHLLMQVYSATTSKLTERYQPISFKTPHLQQRNTHLSKHAPAMLSWQLEYFMHNMLGFGLARCTFLIDITHFIDWQVVHVSCRLP